MVDTSSYILSNFEGYFIKVPMVVRNDVFNLHGFFLFFEGTLDSQTKWLVVWYPFGVPNTEARTFARLPSDTFGINGPTSSDTFPNERSINKGFVTGIFFDEDFGPES